MSALLRSLRKGLTVGAALLATTAAFAAEDEDTQVIETETTTAPANDTQARSRRQQPGVTERSSDEQAPVEETENVEQPANTAQQPGTVQQPGAAGEEGVQTRTTVTQDEARKGGTLKDEIVGIKPQAGIMNLRNSTGGDATRFAVGMTIDANVLGGIQMDSGKPFLGPSVGGIFSHVGASQSNFFGIDAPGGVDSGSNVLLIPLNLKAGWTFGNNFRLAAHGGVNVNYINNTQTVRIGPFNASTGQQDWTTYPNVGGDLEIGFGRNVGLLIRPDWTLASGNPIFTATAGLAFPLG